MTDAIAQIKKYIKTPEGAAWFMNEVKEAQDRIRASEESKRVSDVNSGENAEEQAEKDRELVLAKKEHKAKPLAVSRRDLENVIQWTENHSDPEKDGRYILRIAMIGGHEVLKSTLLMKGEKVSNSQIVLEDPKKILSGEISRVSTKGSRVETFTIYLTN